MKNKKGKKLKLLLYFFTYFVLYFFAFPLYSLPINEDELLKTINAHIRVKDLQSAHDEAIAALHLFPQSKILWEIYIKVLSKLGNDRELTATWKSYVDTFPDEKKNRVLTETLAWGIIDNAAHSSSPVIRVLALFSAYLSQDAKGIEIIRYLLKDTNSAVRGTAVELSANLRDDNLKDEIYQLLKKENVWSVRLEAIRTLGAMKMQKARSDLMSLLQNPQTSAEETLAAVEALVHIWESPTREEVIRLAKSKRAGLRLLACQILAHFEMKDDIILLLPLLDDHNADVRKAALWVIGYLRINQINGRSTSAIAEEKIKDRDALVALKAAWLLTLNDPERGQAAFKPWFDYSERDIRIMAAAHLANCGKYALPLLVEQFKIAKDPYVRMNLSLGLLGQRVETQQACRALFEGLNSTKERWAWDEKDDIHALIPSKLRHMDDLNNSPDTIDKVTRLEILNILAMMKFSQAQAAIKAFLKEKKWGITAMASAALLTEGDEAALELVRNLLNDNDFQIRIQAALILALWGGGDEALNTLAQAYSQVDRELKERVLEGIVKIASPLSIPFLQKCLFEPSQSLRVVAAAGLLLCLYQ